MSQNRLIATQVLYQVVVKHEHLKQALKKHLPANMAAQDQAWIQNVCYQSLRHHFSLQARWQKFTEKPLKDKWIGELMTLSMAQKIHMASPDHAIVDEAIRAAKRIKKSWASGLINKVLRMAFKDESFNEDSEVIQFNHPQWWIDLLKKDWPDHYRDILNANNQKPPLWIRAHNSENFQGHQHETIKTAWLLEDNKASQSQALREGAYSVQDAAAQLAAELINPQPKEFILDACAAPGGKSCHLLEKQSDITLDILEKEPQRLQRVEENFQRLNLSAHRLILGDATTPSSWFKGPNYDKILLDVPCSASGVVRRNPDIKLLRQAEHLKKLTTLQQQILNQIAPLVKIGGQILYVTCSVFRSENERQIKKFLKANANFSAIPIEFNQAIPCTYGIQIITGTDQMDGFYYCQLQRNS